MPKERRSKRLTEILTGLDHCLSRLRVSQKILLLLEPATGRTLWLCFHLPSTTPSPLSVLDSMDYFHRHGIILKYTFLSHPLPFTYLTNPRISSTNDLDRHCHRRLWHASPFPTLDPLAHFFTEKNSSVPPTSNFYTHTYAKQKLITHTLSGQPSSSAAIFIFVPITSPPSPRKMLTPKSNFGVRTATPYPVKSNTLSDASPPSIRSIVPPPRRFYATFGLPPTPLTHHRQDGSPKANWHSAFDRYKGSLDAINDSGTLYIVSQLSWSLWSSHGFKNKKTIDRDKKAW